MSFKLKQLILFVDTFFFAQFPKLEINFVDSYFLYFIYSISNHRGQWPLLLWFGNNQIVGHC